MGPVQLFGFCAEREIRVAAFLARRDLLAVREGTAPTLLLALLDGSSRQVVLDVLDGWGFEAPPHPVAALFAPDAFPLLDGGLFPRWVDCLACLRLGEYVAQTLGAVPVPGAGAALSAGCILEGGISFIAQLSVVGPAGAVFDAPQPCRPGDRITFRLRSPSRSLSVEGSVISARSRLGGAWRCVVSFADASADCRRALGRLAGGG